MQSSHSLRFVEEGMKVFDRSHHEIGKVEWVQFGEDDPDTPEVEAAAPSELDDTDETLVDVVAKAFYPDDLPQEIKDKLLEEGFVRIHAEGLFAGDRYVTPDQIDSVTGDGLVLNVGKDDLLKRQ